MNVPDACDEVPRTCRAAVTALPGEKGWGCCGVLGPDFGEEKTAGRGRDPRGDMGAPGMAVVWKALKGAERRGDARRVCRAIGEGGVNVSDSQETSRRRRPSLCSV